MPANQNIDSRMRPTNWVKTWAGMSGGSNGGKPPEITTVIERATNSMPSVVMKEGMAKRSVTTPLTKPMPAAATRPNSTAGANEKPATSEIAMTIGAMAKTEPTEMSNSPAIIRIVTPIATRPISGRRPRTPRMFSYDRKTPFEVNSNTIVSAIRRTTPASSGLSR